MKINDFDSINELGKMHTDGRIDKNIQKAKEIYKIGIELGFYYKKIFIFNISLNKKGDSEAMLI
jgi:hypothetical protein